MTSFIGLTHYQDPLAATSCSLTVPSLSGLCLHATTALSLDSPPYYILHAWVISAPIRMISLLLTIHMTAYLSAHYCAAVLTPYAYMSPSFTMTLTLIVSLSYCMYFVVYRLACKGHSHFRLGLLCNPRTINALRAYTLCVHPLSPSLHHSLSCTCTSVCKPAIWSNSSSS